MNYLKKIILFFLIGISVNCKEIARINNNNNIRDDKNRLNMEIEKDEKIKILKTKQKLSLVSKVYTAPNFIISNYSFLVDKNKIKEFVIKEDKLESYNKEIKTLIQQIEKKCIYLSLFQEELTNLIFLLVNQIFINRKLIQNLLSICLKILIII